MPSNEPPSHYLVHIYQPYLPRYRLPLFEALRHRLDQLGISLRVIHGQPFGAQALRNDSFTMDWATQVRTRRIAIGGRTLSVLPRPRTSHERPDLVVLEQALGNWRVYRELFASSPRQSLALWGHGSIATRASSTLENSLLNAITLRADWFFAYTESSAESVAQIGFPESRTTILNNSIDTRALRDAVSRSLQNPQRTPAALFIGALDATKQLPLLIAAARMVHAKLPTFGLHIVGDGDRRSWLQEIACNEPWIQVHGQIDDPEEKARLAADADYFVLTGRVGLGAVEAFGLGLPLIATHYTHSAPEDCYLKDGHNSIRAGSSPSELAKAMLELHTNKVLRVQLASGAQRSANELSVEAMASNFAAGVVSALGRRQLLRPGTQSRGA
jgi:glycosyltransferase involved in cell wall biosynthesis